MSLDYPFPSQILLDFASRVYTGSKLFEKKTWRSHNDLLKSIVVDPCSRLKDILYRGLRDLKLSPQNRPVRDGLFTPKRIGKVVDIDQLAKLIIFSPPKLLLFVIERHPLSIRYHHPSEYYGASISSIPRDEWMCIPAPHPLDRLFLKTDP